MIDHFITDQFEEFNQILVPTGNQYQYQECLQTFVCEGKDLA